MTFLKIFRYDRAQMGIRAETTDRRQKLNWQRLARANTHPLRISILETMAIDGGRTMSPSDLSYELRVPLSNVNYHVTELLRSGMITLAGERQVRGATEHFYRQVECAGNGDRSNGAHPETAAEEATAELAV
jgi:Helix-turn-helix domain